jgi:F0F1-type ATP synthase assembly protein I
LSTPDPDHPTPPRDLPGIAAFATLGTTIAATVGVFVGLGIWADDELGTSPLWLLVGLVIGCIAATAATVALVRRYL